MKPAAWHADPTALQASLPALQGHAKQELLRSIQLQIIVTVLVVFATWVIAGSTAGISALTGASVYAVPNLLFAGGLLWMLHNLSFAPSAQWLGFWVGQTCKLGMAFLLLGLTLYVGHKHIVWPAWGVGLLCALKGYVWLTLLLNKSA